MDWVFDNLQLIIAISGAIAWWLNQRAKEKRGESADYDGDGTPDVEPQAGGSMREGSAEIEEEERNRRVMEDIRRKRAERAGELAEQQQQAPQHMPRYEHAPVPPALPTETVRRRAEPAYSPATAAAEARREEAEREAREVMERQQALATQLAALQARRADAAREAKEVWDQPEVRAARPQARRDELTLMQELRDARSLKKAILLREILGTPAGLR